MEGANSNTNQASAAIDRLKKKRRADFDLAQFYSTSVD